MQDQHEFFANGVLVSNCVDSLRYACERIRRPHEPLELLFAESEPTPETAAQTVAEAIRDQGVYWPGA